MLLAALRRKQRDERIKYRTCQPESLRDIQAVDHFIDTLFDEDFQKYVEDTYDELKTKLR